MNNLYEFQFNLVTAITVITYILYIVIALGISASAPRYLEDLVYYTKIYVSIFLIVRFNPFSHVKFTPLDAKIAFNAGMFLLFSTIVNGILANYVNIVKNDVKTLAQTVF
jgi:hypothetical protein